ncbi:hypothetical protein [Scytonema sp. HK-05]|uniref:hypothetical protein n=1 Tax=Scytonema sp. HK-05 TaxID=1137095 RepID=UPI0011613F5F|nr:hypothetical protein [Scytonema sp. HK-05]
MNGYFNARERDWFLIGYNPRNQQTCLSEANLKTGFPSQDIAVHRRCAEGIPEGSPRPTQLR